MSDLTAGDRARYAGLLVLGSMVFLVVYGNRSGALVSLLATYLVLATAGVLVMRARPDRS